MKRTAVKRVQRAGPSSERGSLARIPRLYLPVFRETGCRCRSRDSTEESVQSPPDRKLERVSTADVLMMFRDTWVIPISHTITYASLFLGRPTSPWSNIRGRGASKVVSRNDLRDDEIANVVAIRIRGIGCWKCTSGERGMERL